ncbi:hypothetical protein QQZ08_011152 [Neonectria magnoliae]|uniref:Uncharacterized protein n=1 Tax=Neonectria magnoliae TaxID=2732573 RepID=A0ABR1HBY5_9HYPO
MRPYSSAVWVMDAFESTTCASSKTPLASGSRRPSISATAASSDAVSSGLFCSRRLDKRLLFTFKADGKLLERSGKVADGPWIFWNDSIWTDEVESAPLSTLGWVVQERFLAPHVVHFIQNQIYWECLESMWCEADPTGELLILAEPGAQRTMTKTFSRKAGLEIAKKKVTLGLSGTQHYDPHDRGQESSGYWYHAQWVLSSPSTLTPLSPRSRADS